jgi:hypothetical protein
MSILNSSEMNHSQQPHRFRIYSDKTVDDNLISLTNVNKEAGNPGSESNNVQDRGRTPGAKHDTYSLFSWFPELLCCVLGIVALIGRIDSPLRRLPS